LRQAILAMAIFLAGCDAAAVDDPLPIPPEPVPAPVVHRSLPPAPPAMAALTPADIVAAADQAYRDVSGYVAWSQSKPENIDQLTMLTVELNAAVARMKAGKVRGRYQPGDVVAARTALRDLRSFLANKGD
jgi:hypothetical protein